MVLTTFTAGTKAKASEVNGNFVFLQDEVVNERLKLYDDYEVLNGCLVSVHSPADDEVDVSEGTVIIDGFLVSVSAQTNFSLGTSDVSNPRYDVVVVDSSGVLDVITGTAAATPVVPSLTSSVCPLATVLRPAGDDDVTTARLFDSRYFRNQPFVADDNTQTNVTGTTISSSWRVDEKTLVVPPFVCRKYLRLEADYSTYRTEVVVYSGYYNVNAIRLTVNSSSVVTANRHVWQYSSEHGGGSSGCVFKVVTSADGVDFEQFTIVGLDMYRAGGTPSGHLYHRSNLSNNVFAVWGE